MTDIGAAARRIAAAGESAARAGRDPVNLPAIRDWLAAMGDANPTYEREGLAPPAMIQVWTMRGLRPAADPGDPLRLMSDVLDEAGYTSVVATDCRQEYHRYLSVGEQVAVRSRLTDVTGPKRTALGEGWFVTTESTWYVGGEPVATMRFRVLKYRPPPPASFFWAGAEQGELRIQSCGECGQLRHPPGPACPRCGATKPEYVVAAGTGTVHSFVVHHHPPLPGRAVPVVVALIDLTEGVRMVGEFLGPAPQIGEPVRVTFSGGLPAWRPA